MRVGDIARDRLMHSDHFVIDISGSKGRPQWRTLQCCYRHELACAGGGYQDGVSGIPQQHRGCRAAVVAALAGVPCAALRPDTRFTLECETMGSLGGNTGGFGSKIIPSRDLRLLFHLCMYL